MARRATVSIPLVGVLEGKVMSTYYIAIFQLSPSRLFTAAAILKTRLENQKAFTLFASTVPVEE